MKKFLFSLPLALLVLTGCTSEAVIDMSETQGNAIGFENIVNKASRAVDGDLDKDVFDFFLVYGYYLKPNLTTPIQIFNGVPVQKKGTGKDIKWSYDGVRYWVPGCTYYFYAYSCADVPIASSFGSPAFSLFDANNNTAELRALMLQRYLCDQTHQHDLVYAENEQILAKEKGNDDVTLTFAHALCKIKAVFTTDFPEGYKVYLSNVYVSEFYNRADFNVGTAEWTNYVSENTSNITLSTPGNSYVENKAGSKVETTSSFIIPKLYETTNSENVKLHFTIKVAKLDEISKKDEVILERNIIGTWSPQWEMGKIYTYNINITGNSAGIEPIVFAAEQSLTGSDDWDDSTSLNMTFGVDTK